MTYRVRRPASPFHYIVHSEIGHSDERHHLMQQQQHMQHHYDLQAIRAPSASMIMPPRRKYIDPWDMENLEYIQRATFPSPGESLLTHITQPSPAGEPVASTFYYVPAGSGSDDELQRLEQPHSADDDAEPQPSAAEPDDSLADAHVIELMAMNGRIEDTANTTAGGGGAIYAADRFDYVTGCYAGLDEELFYNAKYESIHDEPVYSMYYTDMDNGSSSNERTSSCGSSSAVSTLQLHTPGFGVRASGRRSIVLPKPEPHIEFPPAPPPHEYYTQTTITTTLANPSIHNAKASSTPAATNLDDSIAISQSQSDHQPNIDEFTQSELVDYSPRNPYYRQQDNREAESRHIMPPPTDPHQPHHHMHQHLHDEDDAHLPFCSLSNCYACVPEHVPVYAISNPATMLRDGDGRRGGGRAMPTIADFDESAAGGEAGYYGGAMVPMAVPVPPNNFGLSKRGLLQIDYSFNWSNLHRFISNTAH